mmetsp:Transcript_12120/g.16935  ORF Transcript_12120/g.16935 Transcript_12120/m.16935 type:complete len:283 (+) Transcript_12120:33-881(+)
MAMGLVVLSNEHQAQHDNESLSSANWFVNNNMSVIGSEESFLPNNRKRKVRFQDDSEIIQFVQRASELSDCEKQDLYWSKQDYCRFRASSRAIATMVRDSREHTNPRSYANVIMRAYTACGEWQSEGPDEKTRKQLQQWTRVGTARRGLERWGVKEIGAIITKRKDLALSGVLRIQKMVQAREEMSDEERADFIRISYEQLTRPAKIFGETMGQADAIAAKEILLPAKSNTQTSIGGRIRRRGSDPEMNLSQKRFRTESIDKLPGDDIPAAVAFKSRRSSMD